MKKIGLVKICLLSTLILSRVAFTEPVSPTFLKEKPKLVLMLVIDQFRADYLSRFSNRFLPAGDKGGKLGGFNYLISKGAYFPFAQYELLQNMTGPGHATVLSGAYPYQMGIATNDWFDGKTGEPVYCVEDATQSTVGASPKDRHIGTSPRNFIGTTVGDEFKNAGMKSRVVSIAIKDRASILMGGHRADLALWMDPETLQWVSSKYYLPEGKLPTWVSSLNKELTAMKGKKSTWEPSSKKASDLVLDDDASRDDKKLGSFGGDFPHSVEGGTKWAMSSPIGLDVTETAAEKAIDAFNLGKGAHPDILAVSFSSHDYMGHAFGPNSPEMEEMTIADDKAIAQLLNYVQKKVPGGLKNVTVVLTADHGIVPNPGWLKKHKMQAGRVDEMKLKDRLEVKLKSVLGSPKGEGWISHVVDFNFYFDLKSLAESGKERVVVENALKDAIKSEMEGVQFVFSSEDVKARRLPPGLVESQILKTYYFGRSGDVIALVKPFYINEGSKVTHMTGYSYDATVPILMAGRGIRHGLFAAVAHVVDIAPTLSFINQTLPPSLSEGRVLVEALVR